MYCKNCGKELKDGMRFCDRCGQSVRKSRNSGKEAKEREIKELKEERLNRQKQLAEKEKKRKQSQVRRKKKGNMLLFFVIALIILLVTSVGSFIVVDHLLNKDKENSDSEISRNAPASSVSSVGIPEEDITPEPKALPTVMPSLGKSGRSNENKETVSVDNKDFKSIYITDEVEFSYPSAFTKVNSDEDYAVLGLKDPDGSAEVTVYESEYPGGTASSLMKEYAGKIGGSIKYSRAGDDWYVITISKNGDIYHRKYIFCEDDSVVYYDFKYSSPSDDYENYITYMDKKLGS